MHEGSGEGGGWNPPKGLDRTPDGFSGDRRVDFDKGARGDAQRQEDMEAMQKAIAAEEKRKASTGGGGGKMPPPSDWTSDPEHHQAQLRLYNLFAGLHHQLISYEENLAQDKIIGHVGSVYSFFNHYVRQGLVEGVIGLAVERMGGHPSVLGHMTDYYPPDEWPMTYARGADGIYHATTMGKPLCAVLADKHINDVSVEDIVNVGLFEAGNDDYGHAFSYSRRNGPAKYGFGKAKEGVQSTISAVASVFGRSELYTQHAYIAGCMTDVMKELSTTFVKQMEADGTLGKRQLLRMNAEFCEQMVRELDTPRYDELRQALADLHAVEVDMRRDNKDAHALGKAQEKLAHYNKFYGEEKDLVDLDTFKNMNDEQRAAYRDVHARHYNLMTNVLNLEEKVNAYTPERAARDTQHQEAQAKVDTLLNEFIDNLEGRCNSKRHFNNLNINFKRMHHRINEPEREYTQAGEDGPAQAQDQQPHRPLAHQQPYNGTAQEAERERTTIEAERLDYTDGNGQRQTRGYLVQMDGAAYLVTSQQMSQLLAGHGSKGLELRVLGSINENDVPEETKEAKHLAAALEAKFGALGKREPQIASVMGESPTPTPHGQAGTLQAIQVNTPEGMLAVVTLDGQNYVASIAQLNSIMKEHNLEIDVRGTANGIPGKMQDATALETAVLFNLSQNGGRLPQRNEPTPLYIETFPYKAGDVEHQMYLVEVEGKKYALGKGDLEMLRQHGYSVDPDSAVPTQAPDANDRANYPGGPRALTEHLAARGGQQPEHHGIGYAVTHPGETIRDVLGAAHHHAVEAAMPLLRRLGLGAGQEAPQQGVGQQATRQGGNNDSSGSADQGGGAAASGNNTQARDEQHEPITALTVWLMQNLADKDRGGYHAVGTTASGEKRYYEISESEFEQFREANPDFPMSRSHAPINLPDDATLRTAVQLSQDIAQQRGGAVEKTEEKAATKPAAPDVDTPPPPPPAAGAALLAVESHPYTNEQGENRVRLVSDRMDYDLSEDEYNRLVRDNPRIQNKEILSEPAEDLRRLTDQTVHLGTAGMLEEELQQRLLREEQARQQEAEAAKKEAAPAAGKNNAVKGFTEIDESPAAEAEKNPEQSKKAAPRYVNVYTEDGVQIRINEDEIKKRLGITGDDAKKTLNQLINENGEDFKKRVDMAVENIVDFKIEQVTDPAQKIAMRSVCGGHTVVMDDATHKGADKALKDILAAVKKGGVDEVFKEHDAYVISHDDTQGQSKVASHKKGADPKQLEASERFNADYRDDGKINGSAEKDGQKKDKGGSAKRVGSIIADADDPIVQPIESAKLRAAEKGNSR